MTPTCHTRLSLLGANGIVAIGCGLEVTFETRYEYWSVDGTDVSSGIVMELDVRLHRRVIVRRAPSPSPDARCRAECLLEPPGHIALVCGCGIEYGCLRACCDG